jgi:hypothetical protein
MPGRHAVAGRVLALDKIESCKGLLRFGDFLLRLPLIYASLLAMLYKLEELCFPRMRDEELPKIA